MEPILALADIHLGRKQRGDKKVGPGIDWAIAALERGAEAGAGHMIMLGDIIDRKRFTDATYGEVDRFFARGLELFDTVLFTAGNHDTHHTLDLPRGVTRATTTPATYDLGQWAVHTAAVEVDKDPRQLVPDFPTPVDGRPNIGALHTSVTGEWSNNPCLPCTTEELETRGYGAWLLGHVHQPVTLRRSPHIGWVGMGRALLATSTDAAVQVVEVEHA